MQNKQLVALVIKQKKCSWMVTGDRKEPADETSESRELRSSSNQKDRAALRAGLREADNPVCQGKPEKKLLKVIDYLLLYVRWIFRLNYLLYCYTSTTFSVSTRVVLLYIMWHD